VPKSSTALAHGASAHGADWCRNGHLLDLQDLQKQVAEAEACCKDPGEFAIVGASAYLRPMPRKPIELPPDVARAFVREMQA